MIRLALVCLALACIALTGCAGLTCSPSAHLVPACPQDMLCVRDDRGAVIYLECENGDYEPDELDSSDVPARAGSVGTR